MTHTDAKSFRLLGPSCPQCRSVRPRFDWSAAGKLWRSLLAVATGLIIHSVVGLWFRCPHCGRRFRASPDGSEAARE
jgi:hypothetical protein